MKKQIILLIMLMLAFTKISANKINTPSINKNVYIVNYIKNDYIKNKIKDFYLSFEDKFKYVKINYKEFNDDEFYQNFRKQGLSFLDDFMMKKNQNVIIIFYQKRKKKKITIISQKIRVNATRGIDISSKRLPKDVIYQKIISKSLKDLGELLIINQSNRII